MPTATGTINGAFNNFDGHWNVEGYDVEFRGNLSQSVERWTSLVATLEYDSVEDLVGTYVLDTAGLPSYVGATDTSLTFKNQAGKTIKITGNLANPISQRTTVTGQGAWIIRSTYKNAEPFLQMSGLGVGEGNLNGSGPSFGGTFKAQDWDISVAGTIEPPIPFIVLKAALTYGNLEDLTGTTEISAATIGPATITLTFLSRKGGPINITGVLATPIPEPVPLKGNATWSLH
ncbi:hypothetical protein ETB97_009558 [Aspergillus alliaceus]|uniref:Uncharacterized protein n=1 Tax=Petromyces alliaceus TaxID=209559 RepID=A0A8H5ZWL3_PETAA|nr:hypothetical protein ETB97_009558 [Aspergillus burnettii]